MTAEEMIRRYDGVIRSAVSKQRRRYGRRFSAEELRSVGMEAICVFAGYMRGAPSSYQQLAEWAKLAESPRQLERIVQQATDWYLSHYCRQEFRRLRRDAGQGLCLTLIEGADEPDRASELAAARIEFGSDYAAYPCLVAIYRDGMSQDDLALHYGIPRKHIAARVAQEKARLRNALDGAA